MQELRTSINNDGSNNLYEADSKLTIFLHSAGLLEDSVHLRKIWPVHNEMTLSDRYSGNPYPKSYPVGL
jgi:hypothetical protein